MEFMVVVFKIPDNNSKEMVDFEWSIKEIMESSCKYFCRGRKV
jgi:hypothetical protein